MFLAIVLAGIFLSPVMAAAEEWRCRNVDFEISCDQKRCAAASSHTPMDITVSDGAMSVCAYSGCWEGRSGAFRNAGMSIFVGNNLPFSTDPSNTARIAVSIDTRTGAATVLISNGFSTPAICVRKSQGG